MTSAGARPEGLEKLIQPPMTDAVKWYCLTAIRKISS